MASMKTATYTASSGRAGPLLHLGHDFLGDPGYGFLRNRRTVDLSEMRRDLSRSQPLRIKRQDDLVNIGEPALPLLHDLRLESPSPVAGNIDADFTYRIGDNRLGAGAVAHIRGLAPRVSLVLLIPQVLGDLLVQCRFQHILGEQLQQPIRAGQLQAPPPGLGHHRRRGGLLRRQLPPCQLVTLVTLVWIHSIRCHHSQCPSRRTSARRVGPETPFAAQSPSPGRVCRGDWSCRHVDAAVPRWTMGH